MSIFDFRFHEEKQQEPPLSSRWGLKIAFLFFALLMPIGVALTGIPNSTPHGPAPSGSFPDYPLVARVICGILLFVIGWLLSVVLTVAGIVRAIILCRGLAAWTIIALAYAVVGLILMLYVGLR